MRSGCTAGPRRSSLPLVKKRAVLVLLPVILLAGCGGGGGSAQSGACFEMSKAVSSYNAAMDAARAGTSTDGDLASSLGDVASKASDVAGFASGQLQTDAAAVALHAGRARVAVLSGGDVSSEEDAVKAAFDDAQPTCAGS